MVQVDLITGFLGSGKTTFIKKYAKYLIDQGLHIAILENDFGAINVDMMVLEEELGDQCELEMVVGGGDLDCHRRRFKTKLISMGMRGFDRILVTFSISRKRGNSFPISFISSNIRSTSQSIPERLCASLAIPLLFPCQHPHNDKS